MTTRREFLAVSTGALAAMASGLHAKVKPAQKPLEILFLGGTGFLGSALVKAMVDRGDSVRVFDNNFRGSATKLGDDYLDRIAVDDQHPHRPRRALRHAAHAPSSIARGPWESSRAARAW